jgi:hypothetical protein
MPWLGIGRHPMSELLGVIANSVDSDHPGCDLMRKGR